MQTHFHFLHALLCVNKNFLHDRKIVSRLCDGGLYAPQVDTSRFVSIHGHSIAKELDLDGDSEKVCVIAEHQITDTPPCGFSPPWNRVTIILRHTFMSCVFVVGVKVPPSHFPSDDAQSLCEGSPSLDLSVIRAHWFLSSFE